MLPIAPVVTLLLLCSPFGAITGCADSPDGPLCVQNVTTGEMRCLWCVFGLLVQSNGQCGKHECMVVHMHANACIFCAVHVVFYITCAYT